MITSFHELQPEQEQEDVYLPSPERIARMCRAYQQTWNDRERIKRGHVKPQRWSAPVVTVDLDGATQTDE